MRNLFFQLLLQINSSILRSQEHSEKNLNQSQMQPCLSHTVRPPSIRARDSLTQWKASSFHLHFSSFFSILSHTMGVGGRKTQSPFQNGFICMILAATELANLSEILMWPCYNVGKILSSTRLSEPRDYLNVNCPLCQFSWGLRYHLENNWQCHLRWLYQGLETGFSTWTVVLKHREKGIASGYQDITRF